MIILRVIYMGNVSQGRLRGRYRLESQDVGAA